ncbi:MAG: pyridoxal-phosphate dependent enzyme [Chloroflexota bacterium]|nr:pyridoxal-phosphate dependent enzyme [Chloroflexota bacterium]
MNRTLDIATATGVTVACVGCGVVAPPDDAFPARCHMATPGDEIDHVMTRRIDHSRATLAADDDPNPFVRYRQMFRAWHVARAAGWSDERYVGLVHRLDRAVAAVDGHGFRITPFQRADALSAVLGSSPDDGVWVKDETGGVAGSHKARHLMGIMLELLVGETLDPSLEGRPLAIASCGNAALAAAVIAHAAGRRLDVFVPTDADPAILARLEHLHARIELVRRPARRHGDPTVRRLLAAVDDGAIPFSCQGPLNGLAIEGGETLAFEMAEAIARERMTLDRVIIQVGGGALASACAQGLAEARALGVLTSVPHIDTVQTTGGWPLLRAYDRLSADLDGHLAAPGTRVDVTRSRVRAALDRAAHHRSAYMWPWESEPRSAAHGILDDETYDWLAVVEAMLATGGRALVVEESELLAANELAIRTTGTTADVTGTAGLAGLLHLRRLGAIRSDERVAVLFTGARHDRPPGKPDPGP